MALTRITAEKLMRKRLGASLTRARLDGTTEDGSNADLGAAIGLGLAAMGLTPGDVLNPQDADLSLVADADFPQWEARVRLAALEAILGACDEVDEKAGTQTWQFSQFARQIANQIEALRVEIKDKWGIGVLGIAICGVPADLYDLGGGGLTPWITPPDPGFAPII